MDKRIAIDLDNTVADFMAGAIPKMEELFGLKPKNVENIQTIEEAFGLKPYKRDRIETKWCSIGVDDKDKGLLKKVRKTLYVEGRLFRDLPKLEKDNHLLTHRLKELGYRIYFVTARSRKPEIIEDSFHWLETNDFLFDDVFFTDQKAGLCDLMRIPTIIEDESLHAMSCVMSGINVISKAWPWNENLRFADPHNQEQRGRFFRVETWPEMLAIIKEL